jgi:hypothetical protein
MIVNSDGQFLPASMSRREADGGPGYVQGHDQRTGPTRAGVLVSGRPPGAGIVVVAELLRRTSSELPLLVELPAREQLLALA